MLDVKFLPPECGHCEGQPEPLMPVKCPVCDEPLCVVCEGVEGCPLLPPDEAADG